MPRLVLVILMIIACVLASTDAGAQPSNFFNSSPKPLSKSHAHLDDATHCNDCHINGTRDVYTIGAPDHVVSVTLDPAKLAAYNLTTELRIGTTRPRQHGVPSRLRSNCRTGRP